MPADSRHLRLRAADDIADEGDAPPAARLADATRPIWRYRPGPGALALGPAVLPLPGVLRSHQLPMPLLEDLLSAFARTWKKTRDAEGYADREELLDYCRRSANPVGRLLLHLYGVHDAQALRQSDTICTALQLINFRRDLSVDIPGAATICRAPDCATCGACQSEAAGAAKAPRERPPDCRLRPLGRTMMQSGAPLVHRLPGRAGWSCGWWLPRAACASSTRSMPLKGGNLHTRPKLRGWTGS